MPDDTETTGAAAEAAELPADPFEEMVIRAIDGLPDVFRARLGSVAIVIEDEPTPEQLQSAHAPGLLGLYTGIPRTAYAADQAMATSKIAIFRNPHFRQYGFGPALEAGVADTVRHEIAHHFGISDERLHEMARERGRHA